MQKEILGNFFWQYWAKELQEKPGVDKKWWSLLTVDYWFKWRRKWWIFKSNDIEWLIHIEREKKIDWYFWGRKIKILILCNQKGYEKKTDMLIQLRCKKYLGVTLYLTLEL